MVRGRPSKAAAQRLTFALCACLLTLASSAEAQRYTSDAWPEADRLFHRDHRWLGSDAAYSVPLGSDQILWLFGDSWIGSGGSTRRGDARLVSNTIGIQRGIDPSRAAITFHWGRTPRGVPRAFFTPPDGRRLWPAHGIRLGDHLLLFFLEVAPSSDPLGFRIAGSTALRVANPDDPPATWRLRWLSLPPARWPIVLGSGGVLTEDGYLYAFSPGEGSGDHPVYLARWPLSDAEAGELLRPEWWCGKDEWLPDSSLAALPAPLFDHAQTEFSVHRDSASGNYLQFQSLGFGQAVVGMRRAPALVGPWSAVDTVYRPPELGRPHVMIYAAKAHPELRGADLILTYATNLPFALQRLDSTVYYPRFVRLRRF
jgi:hypothetical protein